MNRPFRAMTCWVLAIATVFGTMGMWATALADEGTPQAVVSTEVPTEAPTAVPTEIATPESNAATTTLDAAQDTVTPDASLGSLVVNKRDETGALLPGACFSVFVNQGGGVRGASAGNACDWFDGANDGQFVFAGLASGDYILTEYHSPNGYINGFVTTFSIAGNEIVTLDVPNVPGGSEIAVRTVDAETQVLIHDACYVLHRNDGSGQPGVGTFLEGRCDDSDGSNDGVTPFTGLAAGNYLLKQRVVQDGYVLTEQYTLFTVDGVTDETITVENVPIDSVDINVLIQMIIDILTEILANM